MTNLKNYGRIFFGLGIIGIGALHFFYPGIRPLITPDLAQSIPSYLSVLGYLTGVLLILTGVLITVGKKYETISLLTGIAFLILFFAGHLPAFLAAGPMNGNYWINMNKILALSGGFLLLAENKTTGIGHNLMSRLERFIPLGRYLYAIMLYNFAVGHISAMNAVSGIVPKYIPFPKFWTFMGGVALMGTAISIFSKVLTRKITLVLAIVLFIWLFSLHVYYAIRYPAWQEGENFIGVFTCLTFCGTALTISQSDSGNKYGPIGT